MVSFSGICYSFEYALLQVKDAKLGLVVDFGPLQQLLDNEICQ